jgi:dTDP-4-dehydrorhamnose reductase
MRLLVTGKSGQVSTALQQAGAAQGIDVLTVGRPEFDLANPEIGWSLLNATKPAAIVSAAAYTAVDKAESDVEMAERVNVTGVAVLADLAAELGIPIVHISTDYVFDGGKAEPYTETDQTNPLCVYGATKLRGEQAVAAATGNHAILRTAWVYSPFGNNFLNTMLKLAMTRSTLRVVADQYGNPTSAIDIANAVIAIASNLIARPGDADLRGIFHVVGTGDASWADFATEIFAQSAALGGPSADVTKISTSEFPTIAKRPANSRLDTAKLLISHQVSMPSWQQSTRKTIRRILAGGIK